MTKIKILLLAVAVAAIAVAMLLRGPKPTPGWPEKPVRVIVPIGPGSGLDLTARLLAQGLAERWKQPVVVDNRPGADGATGISGFVAAKDDHTLLFSHASPFTLNAPGSSKPLHDAQRDVSPISAATAPTIVIAASTALPARSLAELVRLARERPRQYFWSAIAGLPEHLFAAFLKLEHLELAHVPYREASTALRDLGAGRLHVWLAAMASVGPQLESGKARVLAVTSSIRSPAAPEIPTVAEVGYPDLTVDGIFGLYGEGDMPEPLRQRIADDVRVVLSDPLLAARLVSMGQVVLGSTPRELGDALQRQRSQVDAIARSVSSE